MWILVPGNNFIQLCYFSTWTYVHNRVLGYLFCILVLSPVSSFLPFTFTFTRSCVEVTKVEEFQETDRDERDEIVG